MVRLTVVMKVGTKNDKDVLRSKSFSNVEDSAGDAELKTVGDAFAAVLAGEKKEIRRTDIKVLQ